MKAIKHFMTIHEHRKLVREGCFRVGLYYQGLTHDLSKYSPTEFLVGAKYYQGFRSPNNAEREDRGYSAAWLHHKGRNRHHYEYWIDYSSQNGSKIWIAAKMPNKYLVEMYMDRVAASTVYNKGHYLNDMPLQYYLKGKDHTLIEDSTRAELEKLLKMLAVKGSDYTEEYIRTNLLKDRFGARVAGLIVRKRKSKNDRQKNS